ncbi:MAG TPA: lamin tail domain-containing protein, partial [Saprospiraceae bacterium]|nr:lamin tail domain-containing protein [Saprospiraceae bacterium]
DYTDSFGGTSSATPGVAGLAALMLSVNPDLTVKEIKENLKAACVKIDTEGGNYNNANGHSQFYGHGRPDAEKAVKLSQKKPALNGAVSIKIAAALVNPKGRSEIGKETVTLVNKGAAAVDLKNWSLKDDKGRTDALEEKMLEPGAELKIKLSMLRLANTGGTIRLLNAAGVEMHKVKYTKEQASKDGKEIEF